MRDTCSPYAARERLACRHGSYGQFEPLIDALPNWDSSRAPSAPLILPSRRGKAFGIADAKTRTGTTIQAATRSQTAAHNAEPRPHRKRGIRRQMRQHARDAWVPGARCLRHALHYAAHNETTAPSASSPRRWKSHARGRSNSRHLIQENSV